MDLGGTRCHSALADLAGEVLTEDVRLTHSTGDAFTTLVEAIRLMLLMLAVGRAAWAGCCCLPR